jgi:hypothetical protein
MSGETPKSRILNGMRTDRSGGFFPLAGVALTGVATGHWLTYVFAEPDVGTRQTLLRQAGHAYLPAASRGVLLLSTVAVVLLLTREFRSERAGEGAPGFISVARTLAILQVSAFVSMEVLERIASHEPLGDLFHGLLATGIGIQVAVAILLALALCLLCRGARAVASAVVGRDRCRARADAWSSPPPLLLTAGSGLVGASGNRGPPC